MPRDPRAEGDTNTVRCEHGRNGPDRCSESALYECGGAPIMPGTGEFLCEQHKVEFEVAHADFEGWLAKQPTTNSEDWP